MATETPKVPTVKRNDIEFALSKAKFGKNHKDFPGLEFWYPGLTVETLPVFINWAGAKYTVQEMDRAVRADAMDLALDFINDEGVLDQAKYLEALENFTYTSGRGAGSKSAIEDDLMTLQDEQNVDVQLMLNGDDSVRDAMRERVGRINELKERIAELDAIYKGRTAKREATKLANEAKKASADLAAAQAKAVAAGVAGAEHGHHTTHAAQ